MSEGRRVQRVERELQQIIASFLQRGFKGPLAGVVSVSHVRASKDLRQAKVYVSVMGTDEDRELSLQSLQDRARDFQREIGKHVRTKFCPKLTFYIDDTTDHVLKIDRILNDISKESAASNQ